MTLSLLGEAFYLGALVGTVAVTGAEAFCAFINHRRRTTWEQQRRA